MLSLSVVVPIYNEEPSILRLYDRLTEVLERIRRPYEIIFVDDASADHSFDLLTNLLETDHRLKLIRLRRAFGLSAALAAGFDEAHGDVVISLDGDVQHAADDIPALLEKIDEGYDIVSGWRTQRRGNWRIANWLMAKVSKVDVHDFGTFNAYRAEILQEINLFGELHRFIPALASFYGARIAEVRIHSSSRDDRGAQYGMGRTYRKLFDLLTIWLSLKYFTQPMRFFGRWGLISAGAGTLALAGLGIKAFWTGADTLQYGLLILISAVALVCGVILFCTGLLGEVLTRTYFESQGRRMYAVREIRARSAEKTTRKPGAH